MKNHEFELTYLPVALSSLTNVSSKVDINFRLQFGGASIIIEYSPITPFLPTVQQLIDYVFLMFQLYVVYMTFFLQTTHLTVFHQRTNQFQN